jgi:hypothetical protein
MAMITWATGVSGTWTAASDWTGGVVPGLSDTAVIDDPGRYSVTIDTPVVVGGLILDDKGATVIDQDSLTSADIQLERGTLNLDGGTVSGTLPEKRWRYGGGARHLPPQRNASASFMPRQAHPGDPCH